MLVSTKLLDGNTDVLALFLVYNNALHCTQLRRGLGFLSRYGFWSLHTLEDTRLRHS